MSERDSFNPMISEAPLPLFEFGGLGGHSHGHTALVYLAEALRLGVDTPAVRFLVARARSAHDKQLWISGGHQGEVEAPVEHLLGPPPRTAETTHHARAEVCGRDRRGRWLEPDRAAVRRRDLRRGR